MVCEKLFFRTNKLFLEEHRNVMQSLRAGYKQTCVSPPFVLVGLFKA
jgi:hypothetical protein